MKNNSILLFLLLASQIAAAQNMGIGTTSPNSSAILDVTSTNKGMLIPRLTTVQRDAIVTPATGLLVFDATTESFWFKSATNWIELVDTSNNLWKKAGVTAYTSGNTRVGIGTSAASYNLHIVQPNANIGLTDENTNKVSGTLTGSDGDLVINSYRSSTTGGNLILQRSNTFPVLNAGNVGIGIPFTSDPQEKLQVNGNLRLQDLNAKLVLHNNTAEKAEVFLNGNDLNVGTAPGNTTGKMALTTNGITRLTVTSSGELNRPAVTGTSNVLPLAFGRVSSGGSIISSTGNFTVTKGVTGLYNITLSNESNVYLYRHNYVILVTPYNTFSLSSGPLFADAGIASDNTIEVRINKPKVYYTNSSCSGSCGPFTLISNVKFHDEVDNEFSILIYKY